MEEAVSYQGRDGVKCQEAVMGLADDPESDASWNARPDPRAVVDGDVYKDPEKRKK